MKRIFNYKTWMAAALIIAAACAETDLGPVLDESTFEAPVLMNPATAAPVELLPENAANLYEEFEWEKTQYGVNVSTTYVLEVDDNEDFSSPQSLAQVSATSVDISVEKLNSTLLALGLPGFEEATVFIRVKSTITGHTSDPLFSESVSRTVVTYQNSECGNHCTVGIIGDATPGGWSIDTDMRLADPTGVDKSTWTVTLYLVAGPAKFRAGDDWPVNWGAADFPTGTGVQDGANIPVPTSGYYKVTLNDNSGAYTFTALAAPEFASIGIIGDATPGGWDTDTDLTKDGTNPHLWTGVVTITDGEAKFRADNDWANNWGATTYPSGFGTGGGPNIPVKAGTYFIYFNDVSGEYHFMSQTSSTAYASIGLVGPAQSGGWDSDTDLIKNPNNPFLWSKVLTITEAEAKFRANDAWDNNWGASTFPGGIGTNGGPNIPAKEGKYFITLNTGTGEYYFLK